MQWPAIKQAQSQKRIQIRSDGSEAFVRTNTLAVTAGACLSPKGEFAQELERISRV